MPAVLVTGHWAATRGMSTILGSGVSDEAQASSGSNALATGSSTGHAHGSVSSATVLSGEQSNTSIICRMAAWQSTLKLVTTT